MTSTLTVAALPIDIVKGDIAANFAKVIDGIAVLPQRTDIIVLPELFSTGYIDDPIEAARIAETNHDDTIRQIQAIAETYNVALCGSFLARTGSTIANRAFFAEPSGEVTYYDKRHLFCLSDESKIAACGSQLPPVIRYRGWNITMAVCYDIRFPVWLRKSASDSDLMLVPANWPEKRAYAWLRLLQARAIENLTYVIGCNRSGTDHFGTYDNLTYAIDYLGKEIAFESLARDVLVAYLNKNDLKKFRERFPVRRDADNFTINF